MGLSVCRPALIIWLQESVCQEADTALIFGAACPATDVHVVDDLRSCSPSLGTFSTINDSPGFTITHDSSTSLPILDGSISSEIEQASCTSLLETPPPHVVPTIMVSNSTAALSLSCNYSGSLAARRGKKPPPSLRFDMPAQPQHGAVEHDSYPDIPSAFLGSPTTQSPTFAFASGDPSRFNMGLSAMCNSLKSLVPPPPFTPTESEQSHSDTESTTRWGEVSCAQLPDADDEEWAFVRDLVVDWHASRARTAEISPPPSPAGDLAYTAVSMLSSPAVSLSSSPTTSRQIGYDDSSTSEGGKQSSPKQMRRKTVIIQAPEGQHTTSFDLSQLEKLDKIKPHPASATDRAEVLLPDEPVPFETPSSTSDRPVSTGSTDRPTSLPGSRPSSTASAKLPVKGILKEKKSVRFSAVPSFHKYLVEIPSGPSDEDNMPWRPASSPSTQSSRPRASSTSTPYKRSPLRESHSPGAAVETDLVMPGDSPTRLTTTPSMANSSPYPSPVPTGPLPSPPRLLKPHPPARATTVKHPAIRALASSRFPTAVGSGTGGAVVGAPDLQLPRGNAGKGMSGTPPLALPDTHRRAPLKVTDTRINVPGRRVETLGHTPTSKTMVTKPHGCATPLGLRKGGAKASPACVGRAQDRLKDKENAGAGKASGDGTDGRSQSTRAVSMASPRTTPANAPATPRPELRKGRQDPSQHQPQSARDGAPISVTHVARKSARGGSRMSVPLRSIFTKLRV